jgi:hypothetical protein
MKYERTTGLNAPRVSTGRSGPGAALKNYELLFRNPNMDLIDSGRVKQSGRRIFVESTRADNATSHKKSITFN